MFMFDVETLNKNSSSVILSMACIHFDPDAKPSPETLRKDSIFIKFDAQEQIKQYKRSVSKSTIDWWAKQCENARIKSFKPSDIDVSAKNGLEQLSKWANTYGNDKKKWVWARGNLDQSVLDSLCDDVEIEPVFEYHRWRDVRTAVDFLYNTENGYCKIEYPGFDSFLHVTKHNPVDDCILDVMMILYGVKK